MASETPQSKLNGLESQLEIFESSSSSKRLNDAAFAVHTALKAQPALELDAHQIESIYCALYLCSARSPFDSALSHNVLMIVSDLLALDFDTASKQFAKVIYHYSAKPLASAEETTLLRWITFISREFCKKDKLQLVYSALVPSSIALYGHISERLDDVSGTDHHKLRTLHGASSEIKLQYKLLFKADREAVSKLVAAICDAKLSASGTIGHLGLLAAAAVELKSNYSSSAAFDALKKESKTVSEFYVKVCTTSKVFISASSLEQFGTFVIHFVDVVELGEILAGVQKAALRNSELTFTKVAPALFESLDPSSLDVVKTTVNSKFFAPLLSGLKSSKDSVKEGTAKSLGSLVAKFTDGSDETSLGKLLDEIFKTIRTLSATAIELKVLVYGIFAHVPKTSTKINDKIIGGLLTASARDTHADSLYANLHTLFDFVISSLVSGQAVSADILKKVQTSTKSGLDNKNTSLRACWCYSLGSALRGNKVESGTPALAQILTEPIVASITKIFEDCVGSPLPSASNGLLVGAYAAVYILKIAGAGSVSDIVSKSLNGVQGKTAILANVKLLDKVASKAARQWFVFAVNSVAPSLTEPSTDLGYSALYTCLSRSLPNQGLSSSLLRQSVAQNQSAISTSCIAALDKFIRDDALEADESLNFDLHYARSFISAITAPFEGIDKDVLENTLVDLLIPCYHEKFASLRNGWIGVCQAAGVDPGQLVSKHADTIVNKLTAVLVDAAVPASVFSAACSAVSVISFVSPASTAPRLASVFTQDMQIASTLDVDDESLAIWKGKGGELVVDVLEKRNKKRGQVSKNSKDYKDKQWEEEVRREIAAKKHTARKLTKDEQQLVNAQLKHESEVRAQLDAAALKLSRGLQIIIALSKEAAKVDNGADVWFPAAVSEILDLFNSASAKGLVGELATQCFLEMGAVLNVSGLASDTFMEWVGACTLRLYDIEQVPERYTHRNLTELLSSQLFSLKLASEKDRFDSLVMMYILPLLLKVLKRGQEYVIKHGKQNEVHMEDDYIDESPEEEQLAMALSIISSNSEAFGNESIPRKALLEMLISLMEIPSKTKLAKGCFAPLAQSIAGTVSREDLDILLAACINPSTLVRSTVLESLDQEFEISELGFSEHIWIACFDSEPANQKIAETIWQENKFDLDAQSPDKLLPLLNTPSDEMRLSVAHALAESVSEQLTKIVGQLLDVYRRSVEDSRGVEVQGGIVIKSEVADQWEVRSGVALSLQFLAAKFTDRALVQTVFKFLVAERALTDQNEAVRKQLKDAGVEIINKHGKENVETLIPVLEDGLAYKGGDAKEQDRLKESVIVLYGNLARHLDPSDSRIDNIVSRLLESLATPSEDVQFAIADCIAPLIPLIRDNLSSYFDKLFDKLFKGDTLAQRRGAAYGIAGLVKGDGMKALSDFDVVRNLEEGSDDRSDSRVREGVLFAVECLSQLLGSVFEPYVLEMLPIVLKSFGDNSREVRDATSYASKEIMKNTTSYGIQKLIPIAIENLSDPAWRGKKGSVQLLGSMAYLDPAQLSSSLPVIIPEIVGVLNDTHKEVRKSADRALKQFGEVIRNPEIKKLVPTLMKAISNPTEYTTTALDGLINTQFVHYIDGPSMALIIHIIDRGMQDRTASTKRKAAQIIGNMSILVDTRDLLPYLPQLIAELESSVVDPVQQTRATAARALGTLVERLGEERFPGLVDKLLGILQDESRPSDRMGSAQALAEIVRGLGTSRLEEIMPTVLAGTSSPSAYVREGFLPMLLFLPVCFGTQYSPYLSRTIPPVLSGLADPDDDIRDIALRVGRLIVSSYANRAVDLLLPELEKGMSDDNARIRLSSVELTGELLFKISGVNGNLTATENAAALAGISRTINQVLGEDKRQQILASLFVCRSDISGTVRIGATNIWKALVANTPRTVKEVLPTLTQIIVRRLASPDIDQRTIAATALGDMVKRVGGNALGELLPTLEESLVSKDSDAKQGICIALRELIESSAADSIERYQDSLVRIVRSAITDANPSVREAAAQAFEVLQGAIGHSAVDEVIPQLLEKLTSDSEQSADALAALQEIMATKGDVVFPALVPTLLQPPIDGPALAALAEAAGHALYRRLSLIISSLVKAILDGEGDRTVLVSTLTRITLAVQADEGCHPLMQEILSLMRNEDHNKIAVVYEVLPEFFANSVLDYSMYIEDIVEQCIYTLDDKDQATAKNSFEALSALVPKLSKLQLGDLVLPAEQTLSLIARDGGDMYVFTLPRGPKCLLPIFLQGLMYGNAQQREASANAIAYIVDRTPAAGLRPFVTTIVGPLIRVIGERFSGDVKSAILLALNKLFAKIPQFLRPFIPQLQRTFIKSLSDTSSEVLRTRAAKALGTLIKYQPRVDPLVAELITGAKSVGSENIGIQTSMLKALLEVVDKVGDKMSERCKSGIMELVENEAFKENVGEDTVVAYARLIGTLSKILTRDEAATMLRTKVFDADMADNNSSRFAVLVVNAFLKDSPQSVFETGQVKAISAFIVEASNSSNQYVSDNATTAAGKLLLNVGKLNYTGNEDDEDSMNFVHDLLHQLCVSAEGPVSLSPDTQRLALAIIRTLCRYEYDTMIQPNLDMLVPSVFKCVRDRSVPIKLAAEKCFLAVFNMVEDEAGKTFTGWLDSNKDKKTLESAAGATLQMRSVTEYVKRVAKRLAGVERERIAAGGDKEAMFSDQYEDEKEIWAIGGVDLAKE